MYHSGCNELLKASVFFLSICTTDSTPASLLRLKMSDLLEYFNATSISGYLKR